MGIKKNIVLSDSAVGFIKNRTKPELHEGIRWSSAVNRVFADVETLLSLSVPDLSEKDWEIILNAYAGSSLEVASFPIRIASDLMDDQGVIDVNDLDNSYQSLVKKAYKFSQAEQYAVMDIVQKFWSKDWSEFEGDFTDRIGHLSAK